MDIQQDYDTMSLKSEEKYSQRKSKKPLMEKRRRARINSCLLQLKSLVLQAMKKDTSHYSKLEKADILEMTVKHLRALQRRQITSAVAADPTVAAKYNIGFSECASEVMRYLGSAQGINEDVRNRVVNHLGGCVQTVNASSMAHHNLQPIHVQIPASQNAVNNARAMYSSERLLVQSASQQQNGCSFPLQTSIPVQTPPNGGQFELVPGSAFSGPVAFCMAPSEDMSTMSNIYTTNSLKSEPRAVSTSPESHKSDYHRLQEQEMYRSPEKHAHTNSHAVSTLSSSPVYSPATSALKEEQLWRPW
ncbi:transcription factor HES-1-like [Mizuhopecten yessoensis]|uniref:Transcription factor HES-4 n=1 Tax=Mizuhopecten yessoensis TaxID=6573 RepID=A0A210R750_MIZYE|nr:transcription factor HES-1-like [Mizuhopecten yessoensis]OWF56768.1 Transcription factor HES-4 [Mizuhopecten yessoensis]